MEKNKSHQIDFFVKEWGIDFHSLLLSSTMLKKSIIDLNKELSKVWKLKGFIDVKMLDRADKQILPAILTDGIKCKKSKVSIYRPVGAKPGKRGDPRFWPYGLSNLASQGDKLVIFVQSNVAIFIILKEDLNPENTIEKVNFFLN